MLRSREANHLFSAKKTKSGEKKSFPILNYFSKSKSLVSTFTQPVDYKKQENHCKGPLFTYGCTSQGVKHWLFFYHYCLKGSKIKRLQIEIKRFQNILNNALSKSWTLCYFKCNKY